MARSYVCDPGVAEDLVMESFCIYLERSREGKIGACPNLPAYIFAIVKNQCLNWLNRRKRTLSIVQELHDDQIRQIDLEIRSLNGLDVDELFAPEIETVIRQTLEQMSDQQREIFRLFRYEGCSYKEIAARLGITTAKIDHENRKAIRMLREALARLFVMLGYGSMAGVLVERILSDLQHFPPPSLSLTGENTLIFFALSVGCFIVRILKKIYLHFFLLFPANSVRLLVL